MFLKQLLILLIDIYRKLISPLFAPSCRFYPSCSSYARQSLVDHGLLRGFLLMVIRLGKCHPFHPGGLDPVPPRHTQVLNNGK